LDLQKRVQDGFESSNLKPKMVGLIDKKMAGRTPKRPRLKGGFKAAQENLYPRNTAAALWTMGKHGTYAR